MATPTKNITYLTGVYQSVLTPVHSVGLGTQVRATPLSIQMMPKFWRSLTYAATLPSKSLAMVSVPFAFNRSTATKMTIFWRNRLERPLRGQFWPRTR